MIVQADLLAARAKLFLSRSSRSSESTPSGLSRPADLERECQEITAKIKQVLFLSSLGIIYVHIIKCVFLQLQNDCLEFPELPVTEDEVCANLL